MPMTREENKEKVDRLYIAHKKTKETLEWEPLTWELHAGINIARKWTVITAAYSGLEQTFKHLIAEEQGYTIQELIDYTEPETQDADACQRNTYPYRTHNVAFLFSELGQATQSIVREFFARFQSLHSYITIESVDQFLKEVSGPKGAGYERWRYTLIEDKELPRNSPEALVAVWGVCVDVARERIRKNQRVRMPNDLVRMPDEMLLQEFYHRLETLRFALSVERQNKGEEFQDIEAEIQTWLWRDGHPLNAFADVLWHFDRYGIHGVTDISDWFSDTLTCWTRSALEDRVTIGPATLRAFVERARGHWLDGASIRWDPSSNRFNAVQWPLPTRFQDAPPPDATIIGDPTWRGTRLNTLWRAARKDGYRVLENRAFDGPRNRDVWFRTLAVTVEGGGDVQPVLTVWEKRSSDYNLLYIVEDCPSDEICEYVRSWINSARSIGKVRRESPPVELQAVRGCASQAPLHSGTLR